tara:strand:- start:1517 stop:2116 length:600 start_codon:yes stop_codon:yes gene_type:complete
MKKIKIGILGSTNGTNLISIINELNNNTSILYNNAEISVIISNKKDSGILKKANYYKISNFFIPKSKDQSRESYDKSLTNIFIQSQVDIILCIGWMRILSENFVNVWKTKCFNVHPSLLPEFAGGMDMDVHKNVLEAKCSETGCTIHEVSNDVDEGKIILQYKCTVFKNDTPESLKQRVQELECKALIKIIKMSVEDIN